VQPPTIEPAVAPPAAAATRPARAQHAPEKAAQDPRPVEQKERRVARARPVRPAIYPLREFFAWTR
jgi:hypothetical protein